MLLRHGRTGDNAGGRIQGQRDTPLDEVGRAQAERAAPLLAAGRPAVLLSSDLSRAWDTAAPIAAAAGVTARSEPRLRELDLGRWQGLTSEQARERFPAEHAAWRAGHDVARGGGETYRQAGERAVAALSGALAEVPPGRVLLAVTHGGTARGALCLLLGLPADQWWRVGALDNTCWSVLCEHERGWRLEAHDVGLPSVERPGRWSPAPAGPATRSL